MWNDTTTTVTTLIGNRETGMTVVDTVQNSDNRYHDFRHITIRVTDLFVVTVITPRDVNSPSLTSTLHRLLTNTCYDPNSPNITTPVDRNVRHVDFRDPTYYFGITTSYYKISKDFFFLQ